MSERGAVHFRSVARSMRRFIVLVPVVLLVITIINWFMRAPIAPWWFYIGILLMCGFFWLVADLFATLGNRRP